MATTIADIHLAHSRRCRRGPLQVPKADRVGRTFSAGRARTSGRHRTSYRRVPGVEAGELGGERLGAAPEHWRWRQRFAERIAAAIDPARFGVSSVYLFGSTELGSAGVGSDIDLIVVSGGDARQENDLRIWLEGWSLCLAEISFQLYGLPSAGLLDVRFMDPEQAKAEIPSFTAAGNTLQALPVGTAHTSEVRSPASSPSIHSKVS